ncbi:MAG: heavy metal translocating P-type ATPase [Proteobacteria bacterium]|nr:heavy metal translocating P-type ATPase [Pseudomonadota bacterium]
MADQAENCFHCGESLAGRTVTHARIAGAQAAFCCPGCQTAAGMIEALGLSDYYTFRTGGTRPVRDADEWQAFDDPAVYEPLSREEGGGRGITLLIDGLTCAACSWLLNQVLERTPGVIRASVNTATGRAHLLWRQDQVPLSQLLRNIARLGYRPSPAGSDAAAAQARAERHRLLKRLAVSGLGMMQVMMFAVALYMGDRTGMDADIRAYLRIVSLLVSTPVLLYAGWPFMAGALRAIQARRITMDVPVGLALLLAYSASVINTARHAGEVYFDSVTMFIFFLTVARYVEMVARHRSTHLGDALARLLPAIAHRVEAGAAGEAITDVALAQVGVGDTLLVRSGEIVPADGEILDTWTRLDESMLTGESLPVARGPRARVAAGTFNVEAPFRMRVAAAGGATILAGITALLSRAQSERPRLTREADRTASRFLARVLLVAALVCAVWLYVNPARAFDATLAVLVVACPCALSLATLVAMASATAALARRGILVTHADAIEGLAQVDQVLFDKTGTLTGGQMTLGEVKLLGEIDREDCLAVAAALEAASEHPIARAFTQGRTPCPATQVRILPGEGIEGQVAGRSYRIGTSAFVARGLPPTAQRAAQGAMPNLTAAHKASADESLEGIVLSDAQGLLAQFTLRDAPRPEARETVAALRALGLAVEILSGDAPSTVAEVARLCGIDRHAARQSPADKLEHVRKMGAQGHFPAMVGDGINDAPSLGGAGVSIAMSRGSALALASADLILVSDSLRALPQAVSLARRAHRIMKQNLLWAAAYNLCAMPLAAIGWVPPWLAAIGMSTSSIIVVLNSLRLMRDPPLRARTAATVLKPALPREA